MTDATESYAALAAIIASAWYDEASVGSTSKWGLPNTGLLVMEHFRDNFPLLEEHFLSPNGGQVSGLNGKRVDQIIKRFRDDAPKMGTEAGRTSRGTLRAAALLADQLNALNSDPRWADASDRAYLADAIQQWIIDNPLTDVWNQRRLDPEIDPTAPAVLTIGGILALARQRSVSGQVAQHLIGAKLAVRFPNIEIPNFGYSTADIQTGRPSDFLVGDSSFHVTMALSDTELSKCEQVHQDGYRVILLVPDGRRDGTIQRVIDHGLGAKIEVLGIESFVAQNIEELGEFRANGYRTNLRNLLQVYNERVAEVEADLSLLIELPPNL